MNDAVKDQQQTLASKQQETYEVLAGNPSSLDLREYEAYWRGTQSYAADWNRQLLGWANAAQGAINQLNQLEPQWAATLQANQDQHDLGPVLDLIRDNLAGIKKLRLLASEQLQQIVKMQIASSHLDQIANEVLQRVATAATKLKGHILDRDSIPLWQVVTRRQQGESANLYGSAGNRIKGILVFMAQNPGKCVLLLILLVVSLFTSHRIHLTALRNEPMDDSTSTVRLLAHRWISVGVVPPLLAAFLLAPSAPISLIGLTVLLSFGPILRLLPPLVEPRFRMMLYPLAGVYALNLIVVWSSFSPVTKREFSFVTLSAVFLVFAYLARPSGAAASRKVLLRHRIVLFGIRVAIAALGAGLVANLFGYLKLWQYLSLACIYSSFIGIAVFTGSRVFTLLLDAGLRRRQAEHFAAVRLHRQALERWLPRVVNWIGLFIWLLVTLSLLGSREAIEDGVGRVRDFPIAGTSSGITLGGVVGFFVILVGGYALSSAIRFLLREEVLSHFHLSRGLPELLSTTLHYLLLVLIFLYAVKVGQVELNRFTVLTGALGVGVGFGLQNIINNFVSGLILQFERPIHIGDVLELEAGAAGTVTRIGIRSSTILTAQGAEIIVPNSNFISNRVTNWTLTEAERRVDVPIGIAYGTELKLVMKLLYDAAATHPDVLTQPPPVAYFKEFGESSLNFELQFWVMMQSNWVRVRSEVLASVLQALDKAGIEIPFPQRDLRLRAIEGTAADVLLSNELSALNKAERVGK